MVSEEIDVLCDEQMTRQVLILVLLEDGFGGDTKNDKKTTTQEVLILVLLEDGFGVNQEERQWPQILRLNPCSTGRWFRRCDFLIWQTCF